MAIIAGVNVPDNLRVEIGLTSIYGVGRHRASRISRELGIKPSQRVRDLGEDQLAGIRNQIDAMGYAVEGDLRRETQMNVRRITDIQCYRGTRHRKGLPVRGQQTRTNARTKRGKRQTVAGKKRAPAH